MSGKFFGGLFSGNADSTLSLLGDIKQFGVPPDDFVMCRSSDGVPTAVYGEDTWDFNPQRLSAKKICAFRFGEIFEGSDAEQQKLKAEIKYIIFCLIYFVDSGRLGRLSVSTLYNLFGVARLMARYCYAQKTRELVGVLSFEQLLSTPVYLADFLRVTKFKAARKKAFRSLIVNLIEVGEERLGYKVYNDGDAVSYEGKQHPVIPTRIYLNIINDFSETVDRILPYASNLESFVENFVDRSYGIGITSQIEQYKISRSDLRPTMEEAIQIHGLGELLVGDFQCKHRKNLPGVLNKIQYLAKFVIHCYTGMRDQEVMRLPYECIAKVEVDPELVDDAGVVRDKAKIVDIVSTTTKFTGYKNEASWLATSEVIKVVELAQSVCRALSKIYQVDVGSVPLFLTPGVIYKGDIGVGVPILGNSFRLESLLKATVIEQQDLLELSASDPTRDFSSEEEFCVGKPWPLSSHQFRRSLAFYGSSSGFISLPSLKKQFKHLIFQMTRYYANNFENIKAIFGFYDSETDSFVLPKNHMAFEFQMGMPMNVAYDILTEVLGDGAQLFGGVGTYIQKQRQRLDSGQVMIADIRAETEKRVADGHLAYRRTLLGGCMKVGKCDSFMLGEFIDCLSCDGSVINPKKLSQVIEDTRRELSTYPEDSGEFQITRDDLEKLIKYQKRFISCAEVE